jgi:hypothetical protein
MLCGVKYDRYIVSPILRTTGLILLYYCEPIIQPNRPSPLGDRIILYLLSFKPSTAV